MSRQGIPLLRGGADAPAKLEDIGIGAVEGDNLLQFIFGLGAIAQAKPVVGGLPGDTVGWLRGLHPFLEPQKHRGWDASARPAGTQIGDSFHERWVGGQVFPRVANTLPSDSLIEPFQ
jgi:hypothetical protein